MSTLMKRLAIAACAWAAACSSVAEVPPLGPASTDAVLAGPLCQGAACQCREEVDEKNPAGDPAPGLKRFEVRVGPIGNDLRVQVGPHRIYKASERLTDCFYVDLPVGKHLVSVRGHGDPSFGAAVHVSEMGLGGATWYRTFDFECGENVCSADALAASRDDAAELGAKRDPCGSTKVIGENYRHGRIPDGTNLTDLYVEATLDVYDFVPDKPSCRAR